MLDTTLAAGVQAFRCLTVARTGSPVSPLPLDPARAALAISVGSPRRHACGQSARPRAPCGDSTAGTPSSLQGMRPLVPGLLVQRALAAPVVCVALVSKDIIKSSYFGCFLYPAAHSNAAAGSSPPSSKIGAWLCLECLPRGYSVSSCLWGSGGPHTQGSCCPCGLGLGEAAGMVGLEGRGTTAVD